jgi:hypothetical protein
MNRILHENQSNDSRTGGAPQGRGEAVAGKVWSDPGGAHPRSCAIVDLALGKVAALRRIAGVKSQAPPWGNATADVPAEAAIGGNPSPWPTPRGLPNRYVDVSAGGRSDRAQLWREIPPRSRLASLVGVEMELSEARTTRSGAKGAGRPAVAQGKVAPPKKGDRDGKLASFFSTKPAFCSSLFVGAPGRRGARRPFNMLGTATIGFRRSARSQCLRVGTIWDCTTSFSGTTFMRTTWCRFCTTCTITWHAPSFSCGIARGLIARLPQHCCLLSHGLRSNGSRLTPQNWILAKNAGTIQSTPTWQTSSPRTWTNLNRPWQRLFADSAGCQPCYGPSSNTLNSVCKAPQYQYGTQ